MGVGKVAVWRIHCVPVRVEQRKSRNQNNSWTERFNPNENDQARKGPCFFQRLIALKCLMCQKIQKNIKSSFRKLSCQWTQFLPHKLSSLWFCDSKKSLKKNKDLLILGHPTYAGPPSTPHHQPNMWADWVTVYNCQLCEKVFFPKSAAYLRSHIFATKRPTDKMKYSLETPFLSRFFIFYDFLNLNQYFRANLQYKSCVQLPIL